MSVPTGATAGISVSIATSQGAAVTNEPVALVIDEANSVNSNAATSALIDAVALDGSDPRLVVQQSDDTAIPWEWEAFSAAAGSRKLVLHINLPSCADGSTVEIYAGDVTSNRNPSGVPGVNDVAMYPMDSAQDYGGSYDGVLYGDPAVVDARFGSGLQFATNKRMSLESMAAENVLKIDLITLRTYAGWIKGAGSNSDVFHSYGYGERAAHNIRVLDTGELLFCGRRNDRLALWEFSSSAIVNDEAWHHIVATVNIPGNTVELWVDSIGTQSSVSMVYDNSFWADSSVTLGSRTDYGNYYPGIIDHWRVIDGAAWGADEVGLHYRNGNDNDAFWDAPVELSVGTIGPAAAHYYRLLRSQ